MQTAAKNSLVLTDPSSLKRLKSLQNTTSYAGFYQQIVSELIKGIHEKQAFNELAGELIALAENAYILRRMDIVEHVSHILLNLPLSREVENVSRYYQALCQKRKGNPHEARILFERAAEQAPLRYRAVAIMSLGTLYGHTGDFNSAVPFYLEANRVALQRNTFDLLTAVKVQRAIAVMRSMDGDHRGALASLENLFPLVRAASSGQPYIYYDYMNSLAVELSEVGRLEEAQRASRVALASPYAYAYPEWHETRNDIALRGRRASSSVVACSGIYSEAENVVRLPVPYDESRGQPLSRLASPHQSARILEFAEWKKMVKEPNNTSQDKKDRQQMTTTHRSISLADLKKMSTRQKLLRIMDLMGNEDVGDDKLERIIMILEDISSEENLGS